MPEITQVRFFGSSVRSFNTSLGWGSQVSTCTINLVDDTRHGDVFAPLFPGDPCYFEYDDFAFGGILQSYKTNNSADGYPTYEVTLIDPRELLEGVQLITDEYLGDTFSIPNLYNVYGYWENTFGYGEADVNEAGMPWFKITSAIDALQISNPVQFATNSFLVSLANLPTMPDDYRVGGGANLSLMEFVSRVCEDAGCDFFFRLERDNGIDYIILFTISRVAQPEFGRITRFINENTVGSVSSEHGLELRNETNSKFLIGGKVAKVYIQTPVSTTDESLLENTIAQFWGVNENNTPVIGEFTQDQIDEEEFDNYQFTLPARFVNVLGVGDTYRTDVMEMRAALGGQAAWETYLWSQNGVEDSPHQNKATRLGLISNLRQDIVQVLATEFNDIEKFKKLDIRTLAPLTGYLLNRQGNMNNLYEENIKQLYDYVAAFANEYYGKKYMVRIPFVFARVNDDTGEITTSLQPADGGFLDEEDWDDAVNLNYLPSYTNAITLDDTRIQSYVRFDDISELDLSEIGPDDIIFEEKNTSDGQTGYAFIKCTLDPHIYFLDNTTLFSPRVVINLPGRVVPLGEDGNSFLGVLKTIFTDHQINNLNLDPDDPDDANTIKNNINLIFARFGSEQLMYGSAGLAQVPDLAGLALQSNIETYGPWYATGATGKLDCEVDSTLVPWEYGGYDEMNAIAEARVNTAITNMQQGETGSISTPGAPTLNLGDQLLSGGPYITNITVEVGTQGVITTYRMETWTPRFGRTFKSTIERFAKMSKVAQNYRRQLRGLSRVPSPGAGAFKSRENFLINRSERKMPHTSHSFIAGEVFDNASGTKSANLVSSATYNLPGTLGSGNYANKAFVSLDGLFRPFSTSVSISGLPHYETPTESGGTARNVTELNPFRQGNDINLIAIGPELPTESQFLGNMGSSEYRGIALRGPLVVAGWGYDINNKPVPNSSTTTPSDNFLDNYLQRSDEWKVGPVDIKWDGQRKVWSTGGSSFRVARLKQNLVGGSFASGVFLTPVFNTVTHRLASWTEESGAFRIYDGFEYTFPTTPSGARVYISQEQTSQRWFVFGAGAY